jgi:hypothetical protein
MVVEHLLQGLRQIAQEMKPVGDLRGRRRPGACTLRIRTRPVARNDFNARVLAEPLRQGLRRALGQQGDRLMAFEINQHGAISLAFAEGKIIYAQHAGRRRVRRGLATEEAEQCVAAHAPIPHVTEARARFAAQRDTQGD